MRVRLLRDARLYWNYAIQTFEKGLEVDGDLARHLADNTPEGTVDVLEADPLHAPAPSAPQPAADSASPPAGDDPPTDGTIGDLMAWVDGDQDRAARALAAEQAKDNPRSTVVKRLAALTAE